jgi:hypothetical protein
MTYEPEQNSRGISIIVSFGMDKHIHRTRFALLKGRLTTTATTS